MAHYLPMDQLVVTLKNNKPTLTFKGKDYPCAIGRGGIISADAKKEGDGATPAGEFALRRAFWRADRLPKPQTDLPLLAIEKGMGWGDDPKGSKYNKFIESGYPDDGEECLYRVDEIYDLVVVIGYNDSPAQPGKGSAIFLHVARDDYSPTAGCVALHKDHLMAILPHLDSETTILIKP